MDNRQRVLDWRSHHDERSRGFGVAEKVGNAPVKPLNWRTGRILDQGREGRCVSFGFSQEAASSPIRVKNIDDNWANGFWPEVVQQDHNMGNYWDDGASVLAGAKAFKNRGLCDAYYWSFGIDQVRLALTLGPVVLGVNWYDSMYYTRPSGMVEVNGPLVGGHCILLTGYHPRKRILGEGWFKRYEVYRWTNSWSEGYGRRGHGWIKVEDLARLLAANGEACVPVGRKGA